MNGWVNGELDGWNGRGGSWVFSLLLTSCLSRRKVIVSLIWMAMCVLSLCDVSCPVVFIDAFS